MANPELEFLKNDAGENEGLGDAGIETFKDDPYASCGRESGQNSRDAAAELPVRMSFDMLNVPRSEIPGIEALTETVEACLSAAKQEKDEDFFSQASALLGEATVKILEISDYNTKGLAGPSDLEDTPFHSLLKGAGVSNKDSDTSGGSFGIGKNASFAVSDIQTVFYSTVYKDPATDAEHFAAQGKVRLVSHTDRHGMKRRATGYWGDPNGYVAVTDRELVPEWMQRNELGTSIFSIGFREDKAWSRHIAYSLLANFFYAVHAGDMIFEVDNGAIKINKNTVSGLFKDDTIRDAAEVAGQSHALEFSENLYRCLVSPETKVIERDIDGLGKMRFHILVAEGMPKRVGIIRNGMLITTSLEHFGSRLERFPGSKEFIALVEPDSDSASKLMKTLENPKHDSFSPHRLSDPLKRSRAETAMKKLDDELRKAIKELTAIVDSDEVVLDELSPYFAEQSSGEAPPDDKAERDPEKYVFEPPKRRRKRTLKPAPSKGTEGGSGETTNDDIGGKAGTGAGTGGGSGGTGKRGTSLPIELRDFRNRINASEQEASERTLWFTPDVTGVARLRLEATGINSSEVLTIVDTSEGKLSGGSILLDVHAGERVHLEVRFDNAYAGPVEAIAVLQDEEQAA